MGTMKRIQARKSAPVVKYPSQQMLTTVSPFYRLKSDLVSRRRSILQVQHDDMGKC